MIRSTFRSRRAGLLVTSVAAISAASALASIPAQAQVLFNFNYELGNAVSAVLNPAGTLNVTSSVGSATMTSNFSPSTIIQSSGSLINALGGDTAGLDITFQNGTAGNNGNFATITCSTLGTSSALLFSTAFRRSSTAAFTSVQLSYSTDGTVFTPIKDLVGTVTTNYTFASAPLPLTFSNQAAAYLRLSFTGGTVSSTTSTSNIRLDNTRLAVANVPAPSALMPFALGVPALALRLRRRR